MPPQGSGLATVAWSCVQGRAGKLVAPIRSRRDLSTGMVSTMATGYTDNLGLDAEIEQAIDFLAGELNTGRSEVIRTILLDWLISTGRLPVDALDEESETQGTA